MVSAIAPSRSETRNLSRVSVMVSSQHLQLHSSSANLGLPAVYGESILYQVYFLFIRSSTFLKRPYQRGGLVGSKSLLRRRRPAACPRGTRTQRNLIFTTRAGALTGQSRIPLKKRWDELLRSVLKRGRSPRRNFKLYFFLQKRSQLQTATAQKQLLLVFFVRKYYNRFDTLMDTKPILLYPYIVVF